MSISIPPSSLNNDARTGGQPEAMAETQVRPTGQSVTLQTNNQVQLSGRAIKLAHLFDRVSEANGDNKYAYIEDSGLPESVQRLLKHIRDLKEQIREKMTEISKIQNDLNLDEKTRNTKLAKAQTELGILIAALAKTTDTLVQVTRELKADGTLSEDDVKMAGQLAAI